MGKTSVFKRTISSAVALLIAGATFSGYTVMAKAETELSTVYHVYIDNDYSTTVADKDIVKTVVDEKLEQFSAEFPEYEAIISNEITYIPEQVFRKSADIEDTQKNVEILDSVLDVKASASVITIDGKAAVSVKNKQEVDDLLTKIKLDYVSKETLQALTQETKEQTLAQGEETIVDVSFAEDVSISDEEVSPGQLQSPENAYLMLTKGTLTEKTYKVQDGDTFGSIAQAHSLTMAQLEDINPTLNPDSLSIDQELKVTYLKPLLEVQVRKKSLKVQEMAFATKTVDNADMYKGDTKVKQEGKNGQKQIEMVTLEKNGKKISEKVVSEKVLVQPTDKVIIKGTKVMSSRGTGDFIWPAAGGVITSEMGYRWGKLHKGIDIAGAGNRTIKAMDNGVVTFAGYDNSGYGNKIVINHNNGFQTVYAHLASINVSSGQTVQQGSSIGVMGSTGHSTGVHLHVEVIKNGQLQNPRDYVSR